LESECPWDSWAHIRGLVSVLKNKTVIRRVVALREKEIILILISLYIFTEWSPFSVMGVVNTQTEGQIRLELGFRCRFTQEYTHRPEKRDADIILDSENGEYFSGTTRGEYGRIDRF
jgi:hypothetical protein